MTVNLPILGWCLIILGTFFIALAIIVKSPRTMMRELLNVKVDRLKTFKYYIARRLEAALGFLFVLLGCSLHIYALLAEESASGHAQYLGVALVVTILVMGVLGVLSYRSCSFLAKTIFVRLFRNYAARYRFPIHRDEDLMKELGDIVGIPRDEDETIETFAKKIRDKLGLDYRPRR
jgi:hypothetical protein